MPGPLLAQKEGRPRSLLSGALGLQQTWEVLWVCAGAWSHCPSPAAARCLSASRIFLPREVCHRLMLGWNL